MHPKAFLLIKSLLNESNHLRVGEKKGRRKQKPSYKRILPLRSYPILKITLKDVTRINAINCRTFTSTNSKADCVAVHAQSCIQVLLAEQPLTRPLPIILCQLCKTKPNKSQIATLKFNALNKKNLHQIRTGKTTKTTFELKISD